MADGSAHVGMNAETDEALVARARDGDARAFRALAARHYDAIRRFAWRRCGDAAEADDVAQEALIRIARGLGRFEGRSAFSTWAFGIVLNVVRDRRRADARREAVLREAGAFPPARFDEDPEERTSALWSAVDGLPDPQREAVLLVHIEGLSHREAAAALGCAEATVSWRLFTARRRLRAMLSRSEP